jgi:hypothetical protein
VSPCIIVWTEPQNGYGSIDSLGETVKINNIAPEQLIFLMLSVPETMKKDWKYKTPPFIHFKFNKWNRSVQLKNQNYQTEGDLLEMFHLLFFDDSVFFFETL